MKRHITLHDIHSYDNLIVYEFSSSLNFFLKKTFYVRYDQSLDSCPDSISAIPFVAVMAPISWATGCDLIVPSIDERYLAGLEKIQKFWKKCFPKWSFNSRLITTAETNAFNPTETGLLFSGGVDSLAAYIRNRSLKPRLFTVIGADFPIANHEFVMHCKKNLFDAFAKSQNLKLHYLHTDVNEILNHDKLRRFAPNWFESVSHALMLTALAAPLSASWLKTLLISSCSHKRDYAFPCGGEPEIVRSLGWGNTWVQDDLYEFNRIQKIEYFIKREPELYRFLRVCWSQHRQLNCSGCEKCLRTICELLLNNLDPNLFNFDLTDSTLANLRKNISGRYHFFFRGNEMTLNFWRTIKQNISLESLKDIQGSREFFAWLSSFKKLDLKTNRKLAAFIQILLGFRDRLSHWKAACLSHVGWKTA